MIQRASEGYKYGTPPDHKLAARYVQVFFESQQLNGLPFLIVVLEWQSYFSREFVLQNKLEYLYHKYDVAIFLEHSHELVMIIELDQAFDYSVKLVNGDTIRGKESRHSSSKPQIRRDKIAKHWMEIHKPDVPFFRIQKSDAFDFKFLKKHFGGYIQHWGKMK